MCYSHLVAISSPERRRPTRITCHGFPRRDNYSNEESRQRYRYEYDIFKEAGGVATDAIFCRAFLASLPTHLPFQMPLIIRVRSRLGNHCSRSANDGHGCHKMPSYSNEVFIFSIRSLSDEHAKSQGTKVIWQKRQTTSFIFISPPPVFHVQLLALAPLISLLRHTRCILLRDKSTPLFQVDVRTTHRHHRRGCLFTDVKLTFACFSDEYDGRVIYHGVWDGHITVVDQRHYICRDYGDITCLNKHRRMIFGWPT
ncbi:hypothetical protein BC629DRAFT_375667 [Irpex lacteus]|nr:hypothetical protein BC629DRAFT_375667 [Irpex lacteus]